MRIDPASAREQICNDLSCVGAKSHKRRLELFRNAAIGGDFYDGLRSAIDKDFGMAFDKAHDEVVEKTRAVFQRVLRDFDMKFKVEEIHNPKRDQLRKQMRELVGEAKVELDTSVAGQLATAMTETSA